MPTSLLETPAPQTDNRSFGEELQVTMAPVRISTHWLGNHKKVSKSQKNQAAETFYAEANFVSMGKKLIDTNHFAWKDLTAIRGKMQTLWEGMSLPFPEPGIRLMRRRDVESFTQSMEQYREELKAAERYFDQHYGIIRDDARNRLGELYDPADYPETMIGQFDVTWDFPNVEAPAYLMQLAPALYRQEAERVRNRFNEAVVLAEEAFTAELGKLVEHLLERLSGTEDGKPKIFRDTAITNLTEFFERFHKLNIGSSEELNQLVQDAQQIIRGIGPDELRSNTALRANISQNLENVQSTLDGLMVNRPRRNLIRSNVPSNQA